MNWRLSHCIPSLKILDPEIKIKFLVLWMLCGYCVVWICCVGDVGDVVWRCCVDGDVADDDVVWMMTLCG
jgi:hypothetical protein